MDALVEGRGAIVSIMGEPGIGKTRLVWEVRDRYRDRARFIEARGVSYAQTFPYWPIRDLAARVARRRRDHPGGARPSGAEGGARARPRQGGGRGGLSVPGQPRRPHARAGGAGHRPRAEPGEHPVADVRGFLRARLQARRGGAALPRLRGSPLGRRGDARADRVACSGSRTRPPSRSSSSTAPSATTARGGWASARASATRTATARSRCARCPPTRRASSSRTRPRASCRSRWPSSSPSAPAGTRSSWRRPSAT